jgi:hypothetical protein
MPNIWEPEEQDWERRNQEFNALLGAEAARLLKSRGHALTDEELRSLALPRPPDWGIFWDEMARLPDGPTAAQDRGQKFETGARLTIMALLESDVSLSSPMRMYIARLIDNNWFPPEPIQARREYRQSVAQLYKDEMLELLEKRPGMSKATAERLVAEKYSITVEAMRKRLQRAK